jgi:Bacterial membrane protein YfhO
VVLITSMANSIDVEQGTSVGRLRLTTDLGHVIEKELRAGIDTSEWAYERPDVRPVIKHQQASVFDRQVGDAQNTYQACRYVTRVPFENSSRVTRVELMNLTPRATIALWAGSLLNTASGESQTLSRLLLTVQSNPERWRIDRLGNDVLLLHNSRALPRAWLVTHAEAVDAEEALRRIKGESAHQFDPRRTALLEVALPELPVLTGGDLTGAKARVTDSKNQLRIETSASTATVLVVSEIFYPGWEATIDGEPAKILLTDFLLRGVALPAGKHVVEMRYSAPQARNGAIVSLISLVICGLLAIWMLLMKRTIGDDKVHVGSL